MSPALRASAKRQAAAPGSWPAAWQSVRHRPLSLAGSLLLGLLLVTAVSADCLASDLPLLLKYRGEVYWLPNLRRPAPLRAHDNHSLARELERGGGWAIYPLIRFGPDQTQPDGRLDVNAPPGGKHLLGTDDVGRDVASQLIHGARVALLVGVLSVLLYVLLGVLLGALAGWLRGLTDALVTWGVAVMLVFPTFVLVLVIQGLLQTRSLIGVMIIIGLTGWAEVARLTRGEVLRLSASPHVEAARALGASPPRILLQHVLPGAMGPVVVAATFGVGAAILLESALSFLGLGPDAPSWGRLLAIAQVNRGAWWLVVFPGLAISATVLAVNFVAEALADALDPRRQPPPPAAME